MEQIKQQHPEYTESVLMEKTMDYMKTQLLAAQASSSGDDASMHSQKSDEPVLPGESQQYEDEEDPSIEDVWDSVTGVLLHRLSDKDKGKKQV